MKQARGPTKLPLKVGERGNVVKQLRHHLAKYGYLQNPCHCHDELFCSHVGDAVEKYQLFFKLPVTGQLDQVTLEQMRKPRCGLPDLPITNGSQSDDGTIFFVPNGGKWNHTNLTYFFKNGTNDIGGTQEWDIVRQAFDKWAAVTPLTFTEVADETMADIRIAWEAGDHGDGAPFDGSGGVLAHAFTPPPVNTTAIAGDIHFDAIDLWATEDGGFWSPNQIDLLTVAVHEIGHALGLGHTNVSGAVMKPSYDDENRTLHPDDIEGIQELYGPPVVPVTGTFAEASLWALRSTGGYGAVKFDLGRKRKFVAWGTITMVDSLKDLDDDNAVAIEVFKVDDVETWKAVSGGDHWGDPGASSNVHQGAFVGVGQTVTVRLRSMHREDLDAYGAATLIVLDDPGRPGLELQ